MGTTKKKYKRPKFMKYRTVKLESSHTCAHDGCGQVAGYIQGAYFVGTKRVRVWVCLSHWEGKVTLVLPTPTDIQRAIDAEAAYYAEQNEKYRRNAAPERGESIKTLAASGHGTPIPGDRVKSWRWGA